MVPPEAANRAAPARRVRLPGPAPPLPVGQDHLQRPVRRHRRRPVAPRCPGAVDERQRLRRRHGGGHGGQHRVARLRLDAGEGGLGENLRPLRVTLRLTQVHAPQTRRTTRPHQRSDHPDRLAGPQRQVRDAVPHQVLGQVRQRQLGEYHQVRYGAVVAGPDLGRRPRDRAGRSFGPGRAQIRQVQPGGARSAGSGGLGVGAGDVPDTGGGEEAGHARAGPARAVHPDERGPPAGQDPGPAVPVRVSQRRGGQFRGEPSPQLAGERGVQPGREVVEHARGRQRREHPVGRLRRDAVRLRRGDQALAVPAPVQQADHGRRLPQPAEPAERNRPPGVQPELDRVPVPPQRQQPGLQRWSHVDMLTSAPDISRSPSETTYWVSELPR